MRPRLVKQTETDDAKSRIKTIAVERKARRLFLNGRPLPHNEQHPFHPCLDSMSRKLFLRLR